ncbi:hypothetical protein JXK06_00840 [Patescibacteria group bacterium]|nr:hypothetical protein [Patescibacteria group bacterium]
MKIEKIFVGSWYPRTLFHLNELHRFFLDGSTELSLNKEKLKEIRKSLNPKDVVLKQDLGQSFLEATVNKYKFQVLENGLTIMSTLKVDQKNLEEEMFKLSEFAFKKVYSSLSYLFSLGAPIPKVFAAMKSVMPFTLIVQEATKKEVEIFLAERQQKIIKEFKNKDIQVYYGENIVIINGDQIRAEKVVKECIYYLHDAESQFHKILNMHRFIWEEVSLIKSVKVIKYKDLPRTRDLIMEIESEVIFFKSRIDQLDKILKAQAERVSRLSQKNDSVCLGFLDGFQALIASGNYIQSLWSMTEDYLSGASKLVSIVYQESSNKQINTLQFVFIISAVASIIALGSIMGADLSLTTNSLGKTIGQMKSFSVKDLASLGGSAIIIGGLLYYFWGKVYKNFAGSKISDPRVVANSELAKIKKMLG